MTKLWRLQTNTDSESGKKIGEYCLEHNVLAMGWNLKDSQLESIPAEAVETAKKERSEICTIGDYASFVEKYGIFGGKVNGNVKRLASELQPDDLVWIRQDGLYYLGRVTDESRWGFNNSDEAFSLDASIQLSNIEWRAIGDESSIPGAIATSMIRGKTLQNIWKAGALEFSMLKYNSRIMKRYYDVELSFSEENFYSLLSTEECEDLLCLWLYSKFGYICIPSTNKKSTELYECVLVDPSTGKHIYPQVKAGEENINANHYADLPGEVWLFTTRGKVYGRICENIHIADPAELFAFASSEKAALYLPGSILLWIQMMKDNDLLRETR